MNREKQQEISEEFEKKWYANAKKMMADGDVFVDEFGLTEFVESFLFITIDKVLADKMREIEGLKKKSPSDVSSKSDVITENYKVGYNQALNEAIKITNAGNSK